MDNYQTQALYFKALAHPVRLRILDMLRQGEVCVCHMEAATSKRQAYVSQQLMILRESGLIGSRKDGRQVFYWIADDKLLELLEVALGPTKDDAPSQLDNCSCPLCAPEPEEVSYA